MGAIAAPAEPKPERKPLTGEAKDKTSFAVIGRQIQNLIMLRLESPDASIRRMARKWQQIIDGAQKE